MDQHSGVLPVEAALLSRVQLHAERFLAELPAAPLSPSVSVETLREALGGPIPEAGLPPEEVIDQLVEAVDGGLLRTGSGRFFGWVIGGVLPVALAADWLTAVWDQNAASFATSPAASIAEEVCGVWLKDLLGLPQAASFAIVTGCQMAHAAAFAAARHRLLARLGIDVEADGLSGAPPIRLLTGPHRHESLIRAVRLVGFGSRAVTLLPADADGRLSLSALEQALAQDQRPSIVVLQAGDMNTGIFDPFGPACAMARAAGAWVHVDGAFGLWAAASPRHRHLLDGADQADSWATDGHKWLNQGFDSGYVFMADAAAHRGAFALDTTYSHAVAGTRRQIDWNPEWSRRARVFSVYATLRSLGRAGVADLIDRTCAFTAMLVNGFAQLPDVVVLAPPTINQALVRFGRNGAPDDARTDAVVAALQEEGEAWFGATTWRGQRAMRISVCNWATTEDDVNRAIAAVGRALEKTAS
jgi:glutamate/tyrosine decarboxylase-like PLP-dependent enzyme